METLGTQFLLLFIFAIPVACIAWTVVREQVFREVHEFCVARSQQSKHIIARKFFYLFTCEYCFSHYVTAALLVITDFRMIFPDWRGFLISGFSIVWIANIYMGLFNLIRLDIKSTTLESKIEEKKIDEGIDMKLNLFGCLRFLSRVSIRRPFNLF